MKCHREDEFMYRLNRSENKTEAERDQEIADELLADDPGEKGPIMRDFRKKESDDMQPWRDFGKDGMMKHERGRALCEEALKTINGERQDRYGNPEDLFELISELWESYLNARNPEFNLVVRNDDVAIMMTLLKIARMTGQGSRDNFIDAIGYLALAGEM